MNVYEREVRFEEVDAAGIVFFGRYLTYAHEAMERFFGSLDGGYARLINERRIGFPAVDVHVRYLAPSRYGDVLRIETCTARLGTRSAVLRYRFFGRGETELRAEVDHTVVVSDLDKVKSVDMPEDVRAVLVTHLASA